MTDRPDEARPHSRAADGDLAPMAASEPRSQSSPGGADRPQVATEQLGQKAARGAATTLAAQGTRIVVQSATLVGLSRLLSPADFGLVASVTAFTGIADLVRDFGLSSAALQARVLTLAQRSNLFWLNTATGLMAGAVILAGSVPIAELYGNHKLVAIARALAVVFVFDGLGTQFRADLNRNLRFGSVALADIGSQAIAGAVAIGVAAAHPNTLPLVLLPILQSFIEMLVVIGALRWRPGLPRRGTHMRPLLSFGASLFAVQILTYVSRNTDNVTIGRRFGASALGVYSRAFQFLELPLGQLSAPLTTVALPVLGRLQDDNVRLLAFIRRGQNLLMQVTLMLLVSTASQAPTLIPLVLGDQWRESVPLFQILAVGGAFQTAGYATYWLFLSTGNTASNLKYSLTIRPISILMIVTGSLWGVHGVAWGFAASLIAAWPFGLWWAGRATGISISSLFMPCLRSITCYGVIGVVAWRVPLVLGGNQLERLGTGSLCLILGGLLAFAVVATFRNDVLDVVQAARLVVGPKVSARRPPPRHRRPR